VRFCDGRAYGNHSPALGARINEVLSCQAVACLARTGALHFDVRCFCYRRAVKVKVQLGKLCGSWLSRLPGARNTARQTTESRKWIPGIPPMHQSQK
jgi:hypothetical protein